MIQRLSSNIPFKGNEANQTKNGYEALMLRNKQIAQNQAAMITATMSNQIPMQGAGQKLDVIA